MQEDKDKSKNNKSVSFFKLQLFQTNVKEKLMIVGAIIGSLGAGLSMPIFAIFFGQTINNFGPMFSSEASLLDRITDISKKFIYVGLGVGVAGFIMVWLWMYMGQIIIRKIKIDYFKRIMLQEQGWFDASNPYEFSTKIKSQTQSIENGVNKIKVAW
jgi:ATP-binding cassette subfamily B (MDR/TAP) protein 1